MRHLELGEQCGRFMRSGVRQANGINETAWSILAQDGLAIPRLRGQTDTFGGHDPNLRHRAKHPLDDRDSGGDNARGYGEGAGNGFT